MSDPIVIVSAARTPMGAFQGAFAGMTAANLGAVAIKAAVERAGVDANLIDEVLMGCVLQAGQGQAPARQAALQAGLPLSAGCATIHKVCGSAMKATMLGHDGIVAGSYGVAVVGGMESMTNAPYLLPKARGGYRLGHGQLDGAVPKHLQHQRTVELDVGLHEHTGGSHLAQQLAHRRGVGAGIKSGGRLGGRRRHRCRTGHGRVGA